MTFWLTMNSIGLAVLGIVVYLVLRQLGFVLQRAGPMSARGSDDGPRLGESVASHLPPAETGDEKAKLLVFLSTHCAICSQVSKGAEILARDWQQDADILLIYDCPESNDTQLERLQPGLMSKKDAGLRQMLGVTLVPFAVVSNAQGLVVSKGLVNDVTHLESLLEFEKSKRIRELRSARAKVDGSELKGSFSQS